MSAEIVYACKECGEVEKLQELVPAWRYVKSGELVNYDEEAQVLSFYCEECGDTVEVKRSDGVTKTGRWD